SVAQAAFSRPTLNLLASRPPAGAVPQPSLPRLPPVPQEGAQSQTAAALISAPAATLSSLQQQQQQQRVLQQQQGPARLPLSLPPETAGAAAVVSCLVAMEGTATVASRAAVSQAAGSLEGPVTPGVEFAAAPMLSSPGMPPAGRARLPASSAATDAGSLPAPAAARTEPPDCGATGKATLQVADGTTFSGTNNIGNKAMTPPAVRSGPGGMGAAGSSLLLSTPLLSLTGAPTPQPAFSFPTPAPSMPIVGTAATVAAAAKPQNTQLGAGGAALGTAKRQSPAARPTWPVAEGVKISPLPLPALAVAGKSSAAAGEPTTPAQSSVGTSIAAVLGCPMKALEMMILEAQAMRDQALELRVQSAVLSNRLVRLDNPVLRDRITAAKAEAMALLHANEQLLADLVPQPPPAAVTPAGGTAQLTSDTEGNDGDMVL
ncbi:hypothetical protein VaNZ11_002755, partial [Volvox africanus]